MLACRLARMKFCTAIIANGAAMSEAMAFVSNKISTHWKAQGYLVKGFANDSPDYGVGALVGYVF
ncbi:hypothetical protein GALL_349820 [mine drainage metagenome]|uniref:Uncharacterized protein n=1 Tax=mine drainage metagenome TaxID=410659 RepID=A0A1J5R0G7_9ZZZZ